MRNNGVRKNRVRTELAGINISRVGRDLDHQGFVQTREQPSLDLRDRSSSQLLHEQIPAFIQQNPDSPRTEKCCVRARYLTTSTLIAGKDMAGRRYLEKRIATLKERMSVVRYVHDIQQMTNHYSGG